MNAARLTLHAVAAIAAFVVALAVGLWVGGFMIVGIAAVPAIAASQVAAFAGWVVLDTLPDSPRAAPIGAGVTMALFAHVAFGVFVLLAMLFGGKPASDVADALTVVFLMATVSALKGGWLTLPLAIAAAFHVHRLLRDERRRPATAS